MGLGCCVRWRDRWEFVWRPSLGETGEVEGWYGFVVVEVRWRENETGEWYFIREVGRL